MLFIVKRLALAICLAIPAAAQAQSVAIDNSFSTTGLRFSHGDVVVRYRAVASDGKILLCGAYAAQGNRINSRFGGEVLSHASLELNGERVMFGLNFFTGLASFRIPSGFEGSEAQCRDTGYAVGEAQLDGFEVVLKSGSYRITY